MSREELFSFAADVLGVPPETLSFETAYASIPEWDSMAQLRLVTEMERRWGVAVPFADVTRATSLWELFRRLNSLSPKKAVAVDLDGTLWDGVVGEDGPFRIFPKSALISELKALKERGVLLTILSKNNPGDVRPVFEAGMLAPLRADDFLFPQMNWEPKADNLARLAGRLNLGLDAFVFVDDSPVERLEMASRLPAVTVAAFPPVLSAYFPEGEVTEEDRRKTEEYREEAERRKFLEAGRPADVWKELGCWLDVHRMHPDEAVRVAQLSQRANQFATCTNRYSADDVATMAADAATRVYAVRSGDRFGDMGLVAFVVVRGGEVVDFTMSCRAAGRGLEERAWAEVAKDLGAGGVREVRATWRDSGRNAPVKSLFDRLGFALASESSDERRYLATI